MKKHFYCWIIWRKCETFKNWTIQDVTPIEESLYKTYPKIRGFLRRQMNLPASKFIKLQLSVKRIRLLLPIKKG